VRRALAAAVLGGLLVGACEALTGPSEPVVCPAVLVVADAAKDTKYREGGTDLTDVRFAAAVENVNWVCVYHDDGTAEIEITVDFSAFRGPAAGDGPARFDYFVALADPRREILAKQVFDLVVPFEGNLTAVTVRRVAGVTFHVESPSVGAAHRIFVGFQLDAAELERNRR
jgi:hypothetical protein